MNDFLESFARYIINHNREMFDTRDAREARVREVVGKLGRDHLCDKKWLQMEVKQLVDQLRGELKAAKNRYEEIYVEGALLTACYFADLIDGGPLMEPAKSVRYDV